MASQTASEGELRTNDGLTATRIQKRLMWKTALIALLFFSGRLLYFPAFRRSFSVVIPLRIDHRKIRLVRRSDFQP